MNKYPRFIGSSANPEKLAATIKGLILLLVPVISSTLRLAGIDILESEIMTLVNLGFTICGSSVALFGLVRKAIAVAKDLIAKFKR